MRASSPSRAVNLVANAAGVILPLLVTFVTVPIYLKHVGAPRYGVILVAWALLGYLGFMDFGMSRATTTALAKLQGPEHRDERHRTFWSSIIVSCILGAIAFVVALGALQIMFRFVLDMPVDVRREALLSSFSIAAMLPVAMLMGVVVGGVESQEKFVQLNIVQAIGLVAGQLVPLAIALKLGPNLPLIITSMFLIRLSVCGGIAGLAFRSLSISLRPVFDRATVRSLFSFGGWVSVTNIVSPIMTMMDQFLIGHLKGIAQVPFYSVPMTVVQRVQLLPAILLRTLYPQLAREGREKQMSSVHLSLIVLSLVSTTAYVALINCGGDLLGWWLGADMKTQGAPVLMILAVGAWCNGLAYILFGAIQGAGRPKVVALIHCSEILPYLLALFLLVKHFGLTGAALAWSGRVIVDALALAVAYRLGRETIAQLAIGFAAILVSLVVAFATPLNFTHAIAFSVFVVSLHLLLLYLASKELRQVIVDTLRVFTRAPAVR